ncbi:MAG: PEP-CTERM sorting domain-containing protein [Gemmatimonadota bacterium]
MKQIFRNAVGVAVAAMAVVAPLSASTGDGHFQLLSKAAPSDWFNRTGEFTASYNPITLPTNTAFSVFCVDRTGSITPGDNYDVWVSEIAAGPLSNTELGGAGNPDAYEIYRRQAFLVQTYFAMGGNTGLTGSENDWQFAIWGLKEAGGLGATAASFFAAFDAQGTLAWNIIVATGALGAAGAAFDATDWRVITDASNDCLNKDGGPAKCQELIFKNGSPPEEIVPEPATMSLLAMGLAGMAGAGVRRRKQK